MTTINYNPYVPCIKIALGNHNIELARENIISMSVESKASQPLNIKLSLYDDSSLMLESYFLKYKDDIKIQYGYEGGVLSPVYKCTLMSYNPTFSAGGVILDVTLTPPTAQQSDTKSKTYTGKISDIVKQIAKEEGWEIGYIEPTKTEGSYSRVNTTAAAFIKNELVPRAESQKGRSGYLFQLDSSPSKPTVSFRTADIEFTPVDTYQVFIGRESERVLSFSPSYTVYPTEYNMTSIDPETNEVFSTNIKGPNQFARQQRPFAQSSYKVTDLVSVAKNMYATNSSMFKKATLVLRGDPTLAGSGLKVISVVVMTKDGLPHSSSGNYLILGVTDEIEEGSYTTTLELASSVNEPTVSTTNTTDNNNTVNTENEGDYNSSLVSGLPSQNIVGKTLRNKLGEWVCPTKGVITAGYPYYPGGGSHKGFDISDRSQPPVYAARAGKVIKVNSYDKRHTSFVSGLGWNAFGNCVCIQHDNNVVSIYGHMKAGSVCVKEGQYVAQGDQLGNQGNTGIAMGATGIHLHFEIREGGLTGAAICPVDNYRVGDQW